MQQSVGVLIATSLFTLFSTQAWADACSTRHFYNDSDATIAVSLSKGKCNLEGNANQPVCTIPPHSKVELHWSNINDPRHPDQITFSDGKTRGWTLTTTTPYSCKIIHPNDTGLYSINDGQGKGVDGDITRRQQ